MDECRELLGYDRLHAADQLGVRDHPVPVGIRVLVGPPERIAAQVEHLGRTQSCEWLEPALERLGPLFHQHHFPVIVPDGQELSVIADVEEGPARVLLDLTHGGGQTGRVSGQGRSHLSQQIRQRGLTDGEDALLWPVEINDDHQNGNQSQGKEQDGQGISFAIRAVSHTHQ
jgi:hypothetical protein